MDRWKLFATITLVLGLGTAAHAHGSDEGPASFRSPDTPETDPHAGEGLFSSLKHNETEKDVRDAQEQLDIQRTIATLSCASPGDLAALDHQGDMLDVRLAIAVARKKRDQARKAGKKKLADKLERQIHGAKLKLLAIAEQVTDRSSRPE